MIDNFHEALLHLKHEDERLSEAVQWIHKKSNIIKSMYLKNFGFNHEAMYEDCLHEAIYILLRKNDYRGSQEDTAKAYLWKIIYHASIKKLNKQSKDLQLLEQIKASHPQHEPLDDPTSDEPRRTHDEAPKPLSSALPMWLLDALHVEQEDLDRDDLAALAAHIEQIDAVLLPALMDHVAPQGKKGLEQAHAHLKRIFLEGVTLDQLCKEEQRKTPENTEKQIHNRLHQKFCRYREKFLNLLSSLKKICERKNFSYKKIQKYSLPSPPPELQGCAQDLLAQGRLTCTDLHRLVTLGYTFCYVLGHLRGGKLSAG
jgi:DNA-directed RNA polymerase specialized sigma24 family protein